MSKLEQRNPVRLEYIVQVNLNNRWIDFSMHNTVDDANASFDHARSSSSQVRIGPMRVVERADIIVREAY